MGHMVTKRWLVLCLLLTGCDRVLASAQPAPTGTPTAFVQRYASPEELAPIARDAEANCGKPYFGTYCKLADGSYGYVAEGSR